MSKLALGFGLACHRYRHEYSYCPGSVAGRVMEAVAVRLTDKVTVRARVRIRFSTLCPLVVAQNMLVASLSPAVRVMVRHF